jgi:predicted transcriptional regulator
MEVTELYEALSRYHGSIQRVANAAGFSRETVRKVLKGETENADIVLVAVGVLQEERRKQEETRQQTAKALAQLK